MRTVHVKKKFLCLTVACYNSTDAVIVLHSCAVIDGSQFEAVTSAIHSDVM